MNIKKWYEKFKTTNNMYVGNGWRELINNLCEDIIAIDDTIEVVQVKEKFGGLRFYIRRGNTEIYDLINNAESKSLNICEKCGSKEGVETKPNKGEMWILTLCKKCRNKNE